jgi:hypothetical protein
MQNCDRHQHRRRNCSLTEGKGGKFAEHAEPISANVVKNMYNIYSFHATRTNGWREGGYREGEERINLN